MATDAGRAMNRNYGFSLCTYDQDGNALEWLAELDDYDAGKMLFGFYVTKYPDQRILWRQGARIISEHKPK